MKYKMKSIYVSNSWKAWLLCLAFLLPTGFLSAQSAKSFFEDNDLTIVGAYYYPEHWSENEWERDLKKMAELGFEFTHFAEFAWAQLEPEEGVYNFAWLDKAVALAAKYKLKVVMCTSTATPPIWLTRKHPEILITHEDGTRLDHGARQHASFTNRLYRQYSMKMIEKLAEHYGNDPRIIGWQLDNEPAVQFDFSEEAKGLFQDFLREKYHNDINELNAAWGTSFWSQTYQTFEQIHLPKFDMMFMNHHQILDYRRFAALQTTSFLDEQCLLIKKYSKNQWVTSNYIPNYDEGHIGRSETLDFQSYTRYMVYGDDEGVGKDSYRIGDPLRIAWANDFFRPFQGIYGVMELQPGQVNWGSVNPQPYPGAIRLWLWSVFAGGSGFTCTYRFRQPLFGTEQYHYGIVGPDGVTVTAGGLEYKQFADEIKSLRKQYSPKENKPSEYLKRKTAILFHHENAWSIDRQKQNKTWNTLRHVGNYYNALKSFAAPVDFIDERKEFSDYPVIIAPAYQLIDQALVQRWTDYVKQGGHLVLSCRTGHKDRNGRLFPTRFAEPTFDLIGAEMDFYDLLLPEHPEKVSMEGNSYSWNTWAEIFTPAKGTEVWAQYDVDIYKNKPAVIHHSLGKGTVTYIGVDTHDGELEKQVLRKLYARLNIPLMNLPKGVSVEYRNGLGIALNYSDRTFDFPLPSKATVLIGDKAIKQAGVLVWKNEE